MAEEQYIHTVGEVIESLPNAMFRVKITDQKYPVKDHIVLATVKGKMRISNIRVLPGDKVEVNINIYDQKRGFIVYRFK